MQSLRGADIRHILVPVYWNFGRPLTGTDFPPLTEIFLPAFKHSSFSDRIENATAAKAATVARFNARPPIDDPRVVAKAAERLRFHEGRLARRAERERQQEEQRLLEAETRRQLEEQQLAAEIARVAAAEAEAEAARMARRDRLAAKSSSLADQKALRDARYAARKSRQKR